MQKLDEKKIVFIFQISKYTKMYMQMQNFRIWVHKK